MASSSFSAPVPPTFKGVNYPLWAVKMKAYLRACDLWDVVETGRDPNPLPPNPTVAQIKQHNEEKAKKFKALFAIQSAVEDEVFTRFMNLEDPKEAWDTLKQEFEGSEKTKQMQILNLRREFELLRMKEDETVKQYADRIMKVVSQIRLLGEELTERRIVEKVLISVPEKFEAKISSLEDSKDITKLNLAEVINALQALEQRRAIRMEEHTEGAYQAKQAEVGGGKKKFGGKKEKEKKGEDSSKGGGKKGKYPPCPHCKKRSHSENFCWFRPGVKCRGCNQYGHIEKVCKNKKK